MKRRSMRLEVELLEGRWVPAGPAIDLFTVALHEFGHSLGLGHSSSPSCGSPGQPVMCPFYIGSVTGLQAEDVQRAQALYPESLGDAGASGRWDVKNADGSSRAVTYSWAPDGTQMDQGKSSLFRSFDALFPRATWQGVFTSALAKWTAAVDADGTATRLVFTRISGPKNDGVDTGLRHGTCNYASQGDPNAGDIRIAAHRFDGAGNVLAHAYFAPPNGCSAAGDAHFDQAENWTNPSSLTAPAGGGSGSGIGALTLGSEVLFPPIVPAQSDRADASSKGGDGTSGGLTDDAPRERSDAIASADRLQDSQQQPVAELNFSPSSDLDYSVQPPERVPDPFADPLSVFRLLADDLANAMY